VDTGALALTDPSWGKRLSFPGVARAKLRPGTTASRDGRSGELRIAAGLQPFSWNMRLTRDGAEPLLVTLTGRRLSFGMDADDNTAALEEGNVELPTERWSARGISATFAAAEATTLKLAADLRSTAEPAQFIPLRAALQARRVGPDVQFSATAHDIAQRINASAKGEHHLDSGRGGATMVLQPVDLTAKRTLKELLPSLAVGVVTTAGSISGEGAFHWGDLTVPGTVSLRLKEVAVTGASFKASALNGEIRLKNELPLQSESGQKISGIFELPTLGRVPLAATFRLQPGKLMLEQATAEIFGGAFATTDAEFDLATRAGRLDLKISDLDLESTFQVLNLERLKGTGRISGVLPLRFENTRMALDGGHLEATGPGTIQIGVETIAEQLKDYGQNVDLAFRALTDFHYHRLAIDADKSVSGAGTAVFRLEGSNPTVMDGQPFIFNINLETDFDYLARLLLQISGVANEVLGWGARESLNK